MKKILIFGGNGLVGKKLIEKIKSFKNCIHINLDKNDLDLSLNTNKELIKQKVEAINPNIVIILASIKRQLGDSSSIKNYNDKITDNLTYALSEKQTKIVYLSSAAVYGEKNNQTNFNELSKISPTSSYGEHKVRSEKIYENFIDNKKLLIIRPPLIYDMEEKKGYNPSGFLNSAIKDKFIKLWGNGSELREFILLEDAANIILKLSLIDCYGIYNLTSGKSFSYREIADHISKYTDCDIIEQARTGNAVNHTYDNSKLKSLIDDYDFITPFKAVDSIFFKKY